MKFRATITMSFTFIATQSIHSAVPAAIPAAPWPKYRLTFSQDFTKMKKLDVSAHDMGKGTWIAHKPDGGDWFTFIDPKDDYNPFNLDGGYLTIRAAKRGYGDPNNWFSGYSGGLLSSMDAAGNGFSQQYGYFEISMAIPTGPNQWPGFWLMDRPGLIDRKLDRSEIDVMEEYGNAGHGKGDAPDSFSTTVHHWPDGVSTANWYQTPKPGCRVGFHTYGVDVEPEQTTFYFDRKQIWQTPTIPASRRPLFIMFELALGGGDYNNAANTGYDWNLTPNPSDLKVKYVAAWASPNTPETQAKL